VSALWIIGGCNRAGQANGHFELVIGEPGHTSGRFNRPRGIDYDPASGIICVVDWDGRVQKFTTNGEFRASWIMPDVRKGKPEDLCFANNGNILVADTHYSRVVEFTPDGQLLRTFGTYGAADGQFIYPVGIACDRDGNIYVAEYGKNDRIQKFSPAGTFILSWGSFGAQPGQFQRPSGVAVTRDNQVFVADAVNHRIQVFNTNGKLLRIIGREGAAPGEFRYPYDVVVIGSAMYVLEYGNQRLQKLSLDGAPVGSFGRPGRGDGCFAFPWRCTEMGEQVLVSDTENGRVAVVGTVF
jgi:DNA-binding beta-propeller fold protein YncE